MLIHFLLCLSVSYLEMIDDLKGGSNCPTIFPQCVSPLLVSTNMTHNMPVNSFVKSAPRFVRDALNTVGYSSRTSGCLSHALQVRDTMECCVTLHITSCCSVFNASLFSLPVILQDAAISILLPDWLRMSTAVIKKLSKLAEVSEYKKKMERQREKEK